MTQKHERIPYSLALISERSMWKNVVNSLCGGKFTMVWLKLFCPFMLRMLMLWFDDTIAFMTVDMFSFVGFGPLLLLGPQPGWLVRCLLGGNCRKSMR